MSASGNGCGSTSVNAGAAYGERIPEKGRLEFDPSEQRLGVGLVKRGGRGAIAEALRAVVEFRGDGVDRADVGVAGGVSIRI